MYLNKAFIFGNLTKDPEVRALPTGTSVATFSVATNRTWKDQGGQKKEDVQYHNVVVFGKQADVIAQYMKKGSSIFIEGRMQTRSWDDKTSGEKKYRTEIVAENFQFGPKSGGASGGGSYEKQDKSADKQPPALDTIEYPSEDINPEDIPF